MPSDPSENVRSNEESLRGTMKDLKHDIKGMSFNDLQKLGA